MGVSWELFHLRTLVQSWKGGVAWPLACANLDPRTSVCDASLQPVYTVDTELPWWIICNGKPLGKTSLTWSQLVLWEHRVANRLRSPFIPYSTSLPHGRLHNTLCSWTELPCDVFGPSISPKTNKQILHHDTIWQMNEGNRRPIKGLRKLERRIRRKPT